MNRTDLYIFMENFCRNAKELSRRKNEDYAQSEDPFQNFNQHGEKGFVTRMSDKMIRLGNLIDREERYRILLDAGVRPDYDQPRGIASESIDDTIMDLFNYCWLLAAYRHRNIPISQTTFSFSAPTDLAAVEGQSGCVAAETPQMGCDCGDSECIGLSEEHDEYCMCSICVEEETRSCSCEDCLREAEDYYE